MDTPVNRAHIRSLDIFDPRKAKPVNIIGCGSIGSFLAENLAKMGFKKFFLYDKDIVGEENIGCQNFGWEDIGKPKVEALKNILLSRTPVLEEDIVIIPEFVTLSSRNLKRFISFLGVDSMKARKEIWTLLKGKIPLFVDGRIGGETVRVFSVRPQKLDIDFYESTLYTDDEAEDLPCTARNVADVALFVSAMMANAARRFITKDHVLSEMGMFTQTYTSYSYSVTEEAELRKTRS